MQVVNSAPDGEQGKVIDTAFYALDPAELNNTARHIPYPLETLKTLSPEQWALMALRDGSDLPILQKCYDAFPALAPEWLDFLGELHMTDDKDLFIENDAPGLLPLYQGKMIWQYTAYHDQAEYWLDQPLLMSARTAKSCIAWRKTWVLPKVKPANTKRPFATTANLCGWGFVKLPETPMNAP